MSETSFTPRTQDGLVGRRGTTVNTYYRTQIDLADPQDVVMWALVLGTSPEVVTELVQMVGPDARKVQLALLSREGGDAPKQNR